MRVATSETGAAWNEFFADLVARGLAGVRLVTSDAHAGLVEAIAANLPGASLAALPHPLRREPDARDPEEHVAGGQGDAALASTTSPTPPPSHAQFDRLLDYVDEKLPDGRRAPRRRPRRHARLHRVPQGDLDPDLVQQPRPNG